MGRGVDTVIYELARELGKRNEVTIFCSKGFCDILPENFEIKEIKMGKLFTGSLRDLSFPIKLLKLRENLRKEKFDVINIHHSTLFLALVGFPNVIVTYHGSPPAFGFVKYPRVFVNTVGKVNLRFARRVITISNYLKEELIRFGVPEEKITVLPNGVCEEFRPTWEDRNYMLYVGRLEKHKRVEELISLAREIDFPLKIVGYGPEKEKLESFAKEMGAPVKFLGKVSRRKLLSLYQQCTFFVSASRWEGFGLIFLEANACGKPVVGYNCTAIKERIRDGYNGFKVRNHEELVEISRRLKEDPSLRKRIGKKGAKLARLHRWKKIAIKYEEVFRMVINECRSIY